MRAFFRKTGRTYEKEGAVWFRLEGERYTEYDNFRKAEVEKVKTKPVVIEDAVRGRVERAEEQDFVIVRKDGIPVSNPGATSATTARLR